MTWSVGADISFATHREADCYQGSFGSATTQADVRLNRLRRLKLPSEIHYSSISQADRGL